MNDSVFIRAQEKKSEINALGTPLKTKALYSVFSLLLSIFIVSGPICFLINMTVFYDYTMLIYFGLAICVFGFYTLYRLFYYKALAQDKCGSLKDVYLAEMIMGLIIAAAAYIIL